MIRKLAGYITPFTILIIALVGMALLGEANKKLTHLAKALLNVAEITIIIPAIIIDVVLRVIFKDKIQWIWLIEGIGFLIFCFVFIKK